MRGDRLLSLLLLLQTRGTTTARQIAEELQVSIRTVYRDIDALSISGVPVYAEPGPGGGVSLLGKYTTDLTGLSVEEARAVFLAHAVDPLAQLGLGNQLKQALVKIASALPAGRRGEEEHTKNRVYLDNATWFQTGAPVSLRTAYRAVMNNECLAISYVIGMAFPLDQVIQPYGLVSKAGEWNLVYSVGGRMRVREVSRFEHISPTGCTFTRETGFDLPSFWRAYRAEYESDRSQYTVVAVVQQELLPVLRARFTLRRPFIAGGSTPDSRVGVTLYFESLEDARREILSLGAAIEVVSPTALRKSVVDFAGQVLSIYKDEQLRSRV